MPEHASRRLTRRDFMLATAGTGFAAAVVPAGRPRRRPARRRSGPAGSFYAWPSDWEQTPARARADPHIDWIVVQMHQPAQRGGSTTVTVTYLPGAGPDVRLAGAQRPGDLPADPAPQRPPARGQRQARAGRHRYRRLASPACPPGTGTARVIARRRRGRMMWAAA
jgi:hypothetical protein